MSRRWCGGVKRGWHVVWVSCVGSALCVGFGSPHWRRRGASEVTKPSGLSWAAASLTISYHQPNVTYWPATTPNNLLFSTSSRLRSHSNGKLHPAQLCCSSAVDLQHQRDQCTLNRQRQRVGILSTQAADLCSVRGFWGVQTGEHSSQGCIWQL